MTIAHHRAVDRARALRVAVDRDARGGYDRLHDTVVETTLAAAECRKVRDQLAVLTAPQRAVIECVYYQGRTQAEGATLLDIPRDTVKSLLHAALRTLRTTLSDLDETPPDDPRRSQARGRAPG
jgi:RNA polymerase sigma-70 factor (ECF subfamily)